MTRTLLGSTDAAIHVEPYAGIDAVNWSTLRHMRRSPLHYRHAREHQRDDSDTFRRGRLVHTLVLEPERRDRDYVVWGVSAAEDERANMILPAKAREPKVTDARRGKLWESFKARHAGKTIVTLDQWLAAERMAEAVRAIWVPSGFVEQTLMWTDADTGLLCKARVDCFGDRALTELKTTRDVALTEMSRAMFRYDYHCQLAHYRMGLRAVGAGDLPAQIVAVEALEPHDAALFQVDEQALLEGEIEVTRLLRLVAECRTSGRWPGRFSAPQLLSLPGWVSERDENDLTDLGLTGADSLDDEEDDEL